jgi:hypothetical protein
MPRIAFNFIAAIRLAVGTLASLMATAVLLVVPEWSWAQNADFEIHGVFQARLYDESEQVIAGRDVTMPFMLIYSNASWRLHGEATNGYYEVFSDGHDTMSVFVSAGPPINWKTKLPVTNQSSAASGTINSGTRPISFGLQLKLPWLAYASMQTMQSLTNGLLPVPWCNSRVEPEAFIYRAVIETNDLRPFCLKAAEFTVEKRFIANALKNRELETEPINEEYVKRKTIQLRHFYPGFVGGMYRINATTNVHGLMLPTFSRLERYRLTGPSISTKKLFEVSEVIATNVLAPSSAPVVPTFTQTVWMVDYRLNSRKDRIDYVQYPLTNGFLPKSEAMQGYLKARLALRPHYRLELTDPRKVAILVVMFFAIFGVPLAFALHRMRSKRSREESDG